MTTGSRRPPDFLIIGAARAATSALSVFLAEHPNVRFSQPKEPHFLAHAEQPPSYQGIADQENMNDRVLHRPEDWFALFADTPMDARCGEGSVSTYAWPERSIAAIQHWCPEAKLIVCLREPVARLNSAWQYLRSRGHEPLDDLVEALAAEQNRIDENWHHLWHYRRLSHYETLLEPFYESFGADRIHLVVAEELQTDAPAVLAQVFAFLDLAPHAIESTDRPVNTGGELRSGPLGAAARLVRSSPQLKRVLRSIPEGLRHRLQNQVMTRGEVRHIDGLHEEFEPTRTWVQRRLGRTPSAWTED